LKRTLRRLAVAATGVLAAVSMSVGPAGALNPGGHPPEHKLPNHNPVQVADQSARTDQNAESSAKSVQFLPINANVPVQFLSLGHNGGKTTQSNNSTAKSAAENVAWTDQSLDQHQVVKGQPKGPKGPEGPKPHGPKPHGPKGHDCPKPDGPKGPEGHGPKDDGRGPKGSQGPEAFQGASQQASTHQNAESKAKSEQFLPINANVPIQILSLGSNGGKTTQSNNSEAKSFAGNEAWTGQSLDQHQWVKGQGGGKPEGSRGPKDYGRGPKGSQGPGAFQGASQQAWTDQNAESKAKSEQFLPINANVPVQVLSLGHNGGETTQSNNSEAKSAAFNVAGTDQSADQHQVVGGQGGWKPEGPKGPGGWKSEGPKGPEGSGPAFQGSSQQASTDQNAESEAKSVQVAPINVNAPVQILSLGRNGGETTQSNNSEAKSAAFNVAGTDQSADQTQQAGSGPAFQGSSQQASTDQNAESKAKSVQVAPINVNAPVQILSLGSNGGDTTQSNNSSASSAAGNAAGTSQSVGQLQGLPGLIG
jgi:transcriptional regulator of met regulon